MALLFSAVTVTAGYDEAEFTVGGIPREYDDLVGWTAFDNFMENVDAETEVSVHAKVYLYGGEETVTATPEEVGYLMMRMERDENFLAGHCDNIEDVDFSFLRPPEEGRTFATILGALDELGYDVAWQILNSKDFGVPQSRKRVYIVGYLRERCAGEILSFTNANAASLIQLLGGTEGNRVYSDEGVGITLTSGAGGFGGKTGLYDVALPIKVDTKSGFQLAHPGDSIDLAYPTMNTRRGRVGEKIAHTVTPGNTQGYFFIDMNAGAKLTETARCITARQDSGISKHKGEHSAVFIEAVPRAVVTPDKKTIRQQGRWIKEPNEPMFTLTVQDRHGILRYGRVRKLTPRECWRLQGFTDEQFDKAKAAGLSDGRLYKMAGNAVSVPVVSAVGAVIKRIYQEQIQKG